MIEVGEYVRTQDGFIFKVADIKHDENWKDDWIKGDTICSGEWKEYIIKHSKNIIDLIEVGDYVNGELVYSRCDSKLWLDGDEGEILIVDGEPDEPIISIVTKEQFANIEYRLEENK